MLKPVARSRILKISSVDALMGLAKERNLPISRDTAKRRFAKSEAGKGFPLVEQVVSQMIKEAMHKERLPGQVKKGRLIPLWEFEARLGLPEHTLYGRKDVKKFKIGNTWYVTRRESVRLEKILEFLKRAIKGKPPEPAKKKPQKRQPEKPRAKRLVLEHRLGAKRLVPKHRLGAKKPAANPETIKLIAPWQRSLQFIGSEEKAKFMKRLLLKYRYLTPEQFRKDAEPLLDRLAQRNQQ